MEDLTMKIVRQYQVYLENKAEGLENLSKRLAEKGLNLLAVVGFLGSEGGGSLRLCVEDGKFAEQVFGTLNLKTRGSDVIWAPLRHEPGALFKILHKLAQAHISVDSFYCVAQPNEGGDAFIIISVEDSKKALKILEAP
jgi:hypothetical protein